MRIALLGTRGIPARYGGFETFVEQLALRLSRRGHQVEVHCRAYMYPDAVTELENINRICLGCVRSKHLETITHSACSIWNVLKRRLSGRPVPQVALVCNGANAPIVWPLRLMGIPFALNVDGIERKRAKWGRFGALWYLIGEWASVKFASRLVSDADVIRDYYFQTYGVESEVITYGYDEGREDEIKAKLEGRYSARLVESLKKLELSPGGYFLYVSRLEPENNAHIVIDAYCQLRAKHDSLPPLVIVGNAPYAADYIASLRIGIGAEADVRFYGFQFGDNYRDLQLGAKVYIQATEVGGTHPALVEAMGFGNCVIGNNTPENSEVLSEVGRRYEFNDPSSLSEIMEGLLMDEALLLALRKLARARAEERYSWEALTDAYERLFAELNADPA